MTGTTDETEMTDDMVRAMLRRQAASVQPSSDGLQRIEARLAAEGTHGRSGRVPLLVAAAAAVVVIALVAGALVARRDDATDVRVGPVATSPDDGSAPATTTSTCCDPPRPQAAPDLPPGVWPWPGDGVDASVLDDPVETAKAYVASRVADLGNTWPSEYQGGDANSGEVVFSGDVTTTVLLRVLDGRWYVEAAVSDLVTLLSVDDGTVTARVETGGALTRTTAVSAAGEATSETGTYTDEVASGDEYIGLAWDLGRGDAVKRELFVLDTVDGTTTISEVSFRPPFGETFVPTEAVWDGAGLDASELVVAYLRDRLAISPEPTVGRLEETGEGAGEVRWEAGTVRLRQVEGYWYVIEATSPWLAIGAVTRDHDFVDGSVVVNEPGTLTFTVGDVSWEVPVEEAVEGTAVQFGHETDDTDVGTLRAVFETPGGLVTLAELRLP